LSKIYIKSAALQSTSQYAGPEKTFRKRCGNNSPTLYAWRLLRLILFLLMKFLRLRIFKNKT